MNVALNWLTASVTVAVLFVYELSLAGVQRQRRARKAR